MKNYLILAFILCCSINVKAQTNTITVLFDFDKSEINTDFKTEITKQLKNQEITTINLIGFADYIGSNNYNIQLSDRRVNAVKNHLSSIGVKNITKAHGKGETTNFGTRNLNRRVDITYTLAPKPITDESEKYNTNENLEVKDTSINIKENVQSELGQLDKMKVGESIVLKNFEFIPGRHFLMEYSKDELDYLIKVLKEKTTVNIEIQGHICCETENFDGLDWDTGEYTLSKNRAKYIYNQLISNGIKRDRLSYKGFGQSKPLVEEITDQDRQKNRRVEIMIVE